MSRAAREPGNTRGRVVRALTLCFFAGACGGADDQPAEETAAPTESSTATVSAAPASAGSEPAANAGEVPITLSVSTGTQTYQASGSGECKHADPAAIYGTLSSMWMVGYSGDGDVKQLRLTLWRPKNGGPDQLGLTIQTPSGTHEIDTVTGDGETTGSGTATVETRGEGGRIRVEGRSADGTPVRTTIDCERFAALVAEGG